MCVHMLRKIYIIYSCRAYLNLSHIHAMDINKVILDKGLTHVEVIETIYITMISFILRLLQLIIKFTVEIFLINTHVN